MKRPAGAGLRSVHHQDTKGTKKNDKDGRKDMDVVAVTLKCDILKTIRCLCCAGYWVPNFSLLPLR
jgi:hypothetical protein